MVEDGKLNANAVGLKPTNNSKSIVTNNTIKKIDEITININSDFTNEISKPLDNNIICKNIDVNSLDNLSAMLLKKLDQNKNMDKKEEI